MYSLFSSSIKRYCSIICMVRDFFSLMIIFSLHLKEESLFISIFDLGAHGWYLTQNGNTGEHFSRQYKITA